LNPVVFYPLTSVMAQAAAAITALAGSTLKLFKSGFTPSFTTTLADVVANEADFSGYPSGGLSLSGFLGPSIAPGLGAYIIGPSASFTRDGTLPGVNNVVGGWALVTAGNMIHAIGTFPEDVPFQVPGQGIPVLLSFGYPSG
jgi:hypothetical protein